MRETVNILNTKATHWPNYMRFVIPRLEVWILWIIGLSSSMDENLICENCKSTSIVLDLNVDTKRTLKCRFFNRNINSSHV